MQCRCGGCKMVLTIILWWMMFWEGQARIAPGRSASQSSAVALPPCSAGAHLVHAPWHLPAPVLWVQVSNQTLAASYLSDL